jgi:hypothetical protein
MRAPTFFDYFMVFLFANAAIVFNLLLIPQYTPTLPQSQPLPMVPSSVDLDAALDCCARPLHDVTTATTTLTPLLNATPPTFLVHNLSYVSSDDDQCAETDGLTFN